MEDVQDGIKVSIQDGVTEDPKFDIKGKSFIGAIYVAREISTPQLTAILGIHTPTGCPSCSITTILETVVT